MDPTEARIVESFLAHLPAAARAARQRDPGLLAALKNAHARALAACPDVRLAPELYAAHLAHHSADGVPLSELRSEDLYLACACAHGDPAAIALFEQRYFSDIDPALVRATQSTALRSEVAQDLRRALFVAREGAPPQIALYAGRGDLRAWTRVAVVRLILNLVTRRPKDSANVNARGGGELLGALPSHDADPELAHMKEVYQEEFKKAFDRSVSLLEARDRNLLRYAFVDGLNVDELGALLGVHRATAARWVAAARAKLMSGIRRNLMEKLRVDSAEFASIMRLIRSQLHITLSRHFKEAPPE